MTVEPNQDGPDAVEALRAREANQESKAQARTAVIIVHGMGEQLPVETLNGFVRAALPRVKEGKADPGGERHYFSRPDRVTNSYEARRHLAYRQPQRGAGKTYGQTEFFEYHWSYMMTGNKLSDLLPAFRRLLLRRWKHVPFGIRGLWLLVWIALLASLAALVWVTTTLPALEEYTIAAVLVALFGQGVLVTLILQVITRLGGAVTRSFVDVVRYLDRSPRSYGVRRTIRQGMVDLLAGIHETGRYSRVVVVGHSLGGYIAYDAIGSLWPTMCKQHEGPASGQDVPAVPEVAALEDAARAVTAAVAAAGAAGASAERDSKTKQAAVDELASYRAAQFDLWKAMRRQGMPWLITDFVSVGTPMYFADLLYTKDRSRFDELKQRTELACCPPVSGAQTVEAPVMRVPGYYSYVNQGRRVLVHGAPFAVVRWTNLYFPVRRLLFGDWFGGPLRPLFGPGILDEPIYGGRGSAWPAFAHSQYFADPDDADERHAAKTLQNYLQLDLSDADLDDSFRAPPADPKTDLTR